LSVRQQLPEATEDPALRHHLTPCAINGLAAATRRITQINSLIRRPCMTNGGAQGSNMKARPLLA